MLNNPSYLLIIHLLLIGCQQQPLPLQINHQPTKPELPHLVDTVEPGSLESNIKRLLKNHSQYQLLLWEVSPKHRVIIEAPIQANSIYELIDQIITPY